MGLREGNVIPKLHGVQMGDKTQSPPKVRTLRKKKKPQHKAQRVYTLVSKWPSPKPPCPLLSGDYRQIAYTEHWQRVEAGGKKSVSEFVTTSQP